MKAFQKSGEQEKTIPTGGANTDPETGAGAAIFLDGRVRLLRGDSRDMLALIPDASIDSVVCDPPYALVSIVKRFGGENAAPAKSGGATGVYQRASAGFMGKQWDTGETAFAVDFWAQVYRVLKPGGYVLAFSGTRTYHRLACAIEDSGFEVRDMISWLYGSGFPKSHDVAKSIDKAAGVAREDKFGGAIDRRIGPTGNKKCDDCGKWLVSGSPCVCPRPQDAAVSDAAREWQGWGSALKPACEPIVMARKPLIGTIAENVLTHGTGAINIDGCRVDGVVPLFSSRGESRTVALGDGLNGSNRTGEIGTGRFPANVIHDGSDEVVACFPDAPGQQPAVGPEFAPKTGTAVYGDYGPRPHVEPRDDGGSAARFFYTSKACADDRLGSKHPTVKPVDLMQYLVRLVTRKGGTVLDPFAGTGTTGEAAWREGMNAILIEREPEYQEDIARRMDLADKPSKREAVAKTKNKIDDDHGPLFGGAA